MYKVTIQKIEKDVPYQDKSWKRLTDNDESEKQYDYVTTEMVHDVTTNVLEQTVEDLDLPAVIKAVNGL